MPAAAAVAAGTAVKYMQFVRETAVAAVAAAVAVMAAAAGSDGRKEEGTDPRQAMEMAVPGSGSAVPDTTPFGHWLHLTCLGKSFCMRSIAAHHAFAEVRASFFHGKQNGT